MLPAIVLAKGITPTNIAVAPYLKAAQSCFEGDSWPDEIRLPQDWLEFDVDNVETATAELESRGYDMLI